MTPEQMAELRKAFPPECIGKLPKAGTMLDFVGHAHVTDRLLSVDPAWTWEPCGVHPTGEPVLSNNGMGLWIRLTVGGITRLGYGDVEKNKAYNAKELISDALRNAAMRFGVALDLWAKTELESMHVEPVIDCPEACGHTATKDAMRGHLLDAHGWTQHDDGRVSRPPSPAPVPPHPPADNGPSGSTGAGPREEAAAGESPPAAASPGLRSDKQNGMLLALCAKAGKAERQDRLDWASDTLGRFVPSFSTLTKREASTLIDELHGKAEAVKS